MPSRKEETPDYEGEEDNGGCEDFDPASSVKGEKLASVEYAEGDEIEDGQDSVHIGS